MKLKHFAALLMAMLLVVGCQPSEDTPDADGGGTPAADSDGAAAATAEPEADVQLASNKVHFTVTGMH